MTIGEEPGRSANYRSRVLNARREAAVLSILIAAVVLLIWNGSAFFQQVRLAGPDLSQSAQIAGTALTLNVALILFGWRRYVDLQHEAELRADGERRAAVLATTDAATGLFNRKGFADRATALCSAAGGSEDNLVIVSVQIHRFKAVNDQHGYDVGDRLLREQADSLAEALGGDAVIARLSGDEFAAAFVLAHSEMARADLMAEAALRAVSRPFLIDERMIQVGAFAGIAAVSAAEARIPDLLRRADIAMDHAKAG
ncbi:MAG TPA: GGDEF domain-containing protein, partial [Sphingomicrobium sp.]|nr:GGDEF domain-containing protein [Sphingomicrobium sp.]